MEVNLKSERGRWNMYSKQKGDIYQVLEGKGGREAERQDRQIHGGKSKDNQRQ